MRLLSFVFTCLLFLATCHKYDGRTPHGYDYWQHIDRAGVTPNFGDEVFVYFQIRTLDTVLYESPNGRLGMRAVLQDPALNPVKDPDPVADILPLMSEGDSVTVVMAVTEEMRVAPALKTADKLYYEVVLRKIVPAGSKDDAVAERSMEDAEKTNDNTIDLRTDLLAIPEGKEALTLLENFIVTLDQQATSTPSGLLYSIIAKGEGNKLNKGEKVEVRYLGCLADETVFGENYTSTSSFSFNYGEGRVIKGWEEGLELLRTEGEILLAIPPALGYGDLGKAPFIGPEDTLYYHLEFKKAGALSQ